MEDHPMLSTARTRPGRHAPSPASQAPVRRPTNLVGVLIVAAVEAALVALFLLGWTTAIPAPEAPLAAPTPVTISID
jgi:hypothetical protein